CPYTTLFRSSPDLELTIAIALESAFAGRTDQVDPGVRQRVVGEYEDAVGAVRRRTPVQQLRRERVERGHHAVERAADVSPECLDLGTCKDGTVALLHPASPVEIVASGMARTPVAHCRQAVHTRSCGRSRNLERCSQLLGLTGFGRGV